MQVFSRYSFQKPQSKEMANGFITVTPTHQYWVRFLSSFCSEDTWYQNETSSSLHCSDTPPAIVSKVLF